MKTLQTGNDTVNPAGSGWLDDWNWKLSERIGQLEEGADARRVNCLLRVQGCINLFFKQPYWATMPDGKLAGL